MVSWAYGLDKSALRNGVLKLPDQFFTCPKCHRKRDMREWFDMRTNAGCRECLIELSWSQMWRRGGASVRFWIAKHKGKR
jgi:hypothetical protein